MVDVIQVISLGILIALVISLRRMYIMEKTIVSLEKSILKLERSIVKKKKR